MSVTNYDRFDVGNNAREDFSNIIYNIDPTETAFITAADRDTAKNTLFEWQIDTLLSINPNNAVVDGADAGVDVSENADRINNTAQISDKVIRVSGRADAVDKAGRKSSLNYQLAKAAKSLKRDIEAIITGSQAASTGSSSVASTTGSLAAWLESNTIRGIGGADGGWVPGGPIAPTPGTQVALSESNLRTVIKDCYLAGGNPDTIMVSPTVKQLISEYLFTSSARVATLFKDTSEDGRKDTAQATAQGAVDIFVSDFGALKIVPNRFLGHDGTAPDDTNVYVLDMNMWCVSYFRTFRTSKLARTGDAENRQLIVDYGLKSKQEASSGVVADVDAALPMVP